MLRAGQLQGVIQSFFDELFNHLDPYPVTCRRVMRVRIANGASARPALAYALSGAAPQSWWRKLSRMAQRHSPVFDQAM